MAAASQASEIARRTVERYRSDPCAFAREVLGLRLWWRQEEILRCLADPTIPRIAVKAGQKTSKSMTAAIAAIWWPLTHHRGVVRLTAPTYETVKDVVWKEFRRVFRESRMPLGPEPAMDPTTGWRLADDRGVTCISTNKPEAAAGRSGANQLYIIDEASGYEEQYWEAAQGNLAGGGKLLAISNPTQTSGTFYQAFHDARSLWRTITIDSRENPNFHLKEGEDPIPGLATPDAVALIAAQYGEDSPFFDVRVKGNFPRQGTNAVVPLVLIEQALGRFADVDAARDGELELGVDVARFGDDDSVIQPRRGNWAPRAEVVHGLDVVEVAGKVLEVVRRMRNSRDGGRIRVKIDVIGVGAGVADILKQHRELDIIEVNVAEAPTSKEEGKPEFSLLRDQLWFGLNEWLRGGGAIAPGQPELESEIVAPVYTFDVRGRIKVEPKDSIKKRLKRSPDRADALAMAVYNSPSSADDWDFIEACNRAAPKPLTW